MAEEKTSPSGSFLSSPSTWLALLTMLGGAWLVSQKLTSSRPAVMAEAAREFVGEQALEARLWEDPFRPLAEAEKASNAQASADLAILRTGLHRRVMQAPDRAPVLILAVMVAGGHYGEDTESRVRSRFAVVSALGRSDYAPEDAEHIGVARLPWPSTSDLDAPPPTADTSRADQAGVPLHGRLNDLRGRGSAHLDVPYEWYRNKTFGDADQAGGRHASVLVLWLNDAMFEDNPRLRLALLLEQLHAPGDRPGRPSPRVALIGPRRASTLRAMLPAWGTSVSEPPAPIESAVRTVLSNVDLFCATPSTIDELLVKGAISREADPHARLTRALVDQGGFASVRHFSASDAQLAAEVLRELGLREARLRRLPSDRRGQGHLVLISEWDTFYGRMLALTYGAQLRAFRDPSSTLGDYVAARESRDPFRRAANFHAFVYLRGVDGQTVSRTTEAKESESRGRRTRPNSWDEVRDWTPDINQAEGQAQLDYLGRLGDRIDELQRQLESQEAGEITAIGVVGSDVYDTLLILQALRPRFPSAHFFTTDLDVRFLHPREHEWTRNLIVVSSYGLTLHPSLQGPIAPFRDSIQTAQFTAVLAALGDEHLAGLRVIAPRRFEIGNGVAVDLSSAKAANDPILHPPTSVEDGEHRSATPRSHLHLLAMISAVALFVLTWRWRLLRNLTWDFWHHLAQTMEYSDEDVGGPDGALVLVSHLDAVARTPANPQTRELLQHLKRAIGGSASPVSAGAAGGSPAIAPGAMPGQPGSERLAALLVTTLNQLLHGEAKGGAQSHFPSALRRAWLLLPMRARLDELLDALAKTDRPRAWLRRVVWRVVQRDFTVRFDPLATFTCWKAWIVAAFRPAKIPVEKRLTDAGIAAASAAAKARNAAWTMLGVRLGNLVCWWTGAAVFAGLASKCGREAWKETYVMDQGEPFSLWTGTSAWPAVMVRLLVACLAFCCAASLWAHLRDAFHSLTRRFRFAGAVDGSLLPPGQVCAETMWNNYHRTTGLFRRLGRSLFMLLLYSVVGISVFRFAPRLFVPWRGAAIARWDMLVSIIASLGIVFLVCMTIDASFQCCRFIKILSDYPTIYPSPTNRHFRRQLGEVDDDYMEEWIDLQLIAELTERIGRLVYWPTGLVLLMMLSRNGWWDLCLWTLPVIVTFLLIFTLALASVVMMQRAAKQAKARAEKSLDLKLKRLGARVAASQTDRNASRGAELLGEIRELKRGAFVPFWENPVVSAVFLSSGGTTLIQVLVWVLAR